MKTFENLKLENHRSDVNKSFPVCLPPYHLSFSENWGCQSKSGREHIQKKTIKKCQEFIKILNLVFLKRIYKIL